MEALEEAKRRSPFIANLFCRFSDYLLAQVMQSVACNAFHSIPERAARWLLHAQDRAGDRIELTQEALAGLLGVQRTTVNAVVRSLQDEGLIATGRGVVRVTDRAGLKRRACECYAAARRSFRRGHRRQRQRRGERLTARQLFVDVRLRVLTMVRRSLGAQSFRVRPG